MPQALALLLTPSLGGVTIAGVTVGTLLSTVASLAINALLAPKAPKGAVGQQGVTIAEQVATPVGRIIYGRTRISGNYLASQTLNVGSLVNQHYHRIVSIACHEIDAVEEVYLERDLVWSLDQYETDEAAGTGDPDKWGLTDSPFKNDIIVKPKLGSVDQVAEPLFVTASPDWSVTSRLRGIAYIYFRFNYSDVYSRGLPNPSAVVRGKKVFDPRDDSTAWTQNPFLHARDYMLTPRSHGGAGLDGSEIDGTEIAALANVADEAVALNDGGTEPRYQFNGWLSTDVEIANNLDQIVRQWGGWKIYHGGKMRFGGAAYSEPVADIDLDWMVKPLSVTSKRPFEDQYNSVKAVFQDPAEFYVQTDLPVLESATFIAQDGNEASPLDHGELRGEVRNSSGQRLIKRALFEKRRQVSVSMVTDIRAKDLRHGDTVTLTIPKRGWDQKTFEVRGIGYSIANDRSNPVLEISLSLLETSATIYDWTASEEQPRPAGKGGALTSPFAKPVVGIPAVAESLYSTRTGGVKSRVTLTGRTTNPFVEEWEFSWRDTGGTDEVVVSAARDLVALDDFDTGEYVFGSRARNARGVWSDWVYTGSTVIRGLAAAPVAITGLTASLSNGLVMLRWNAASDLDVRQGGTIEVRHSFASDATYSTSTTIGNAVSGSTTTVTLPGISGTYLVVPRDSTGLRGPATAINVSVPDVVPMTTLATLTESPTFAGTKTDCSVSGSALEIDVGETAATYAFNSAIDLGASKAVRVTARLAASVADRTDLISARGLVSTWASVTGGGGADGDVVIEIRTTTDDPSGTPTWSDWFPLDRSDVVAWGIEARAQLTISDADYVTAITQLSLVAEEPT